MQLGTDILSLKRLKRVFDRFKDRLPQKLLSDPETLFYTKIPNEKRRLEFLAGRFCAKEAIFKATSDEIPSLTWKRVSIVSWGGRKRPSIWIDGREAAGIKVSISHEDEYATSTAVFDDDEHVIKYKINII